MGVKAYLSASATRVSLCASALYGAKIGATPEVHTWAANHIQSLFSLPHLPTIPAVHLPASHYIATACQSVHHLVLLLKTAAIPVALIIPVLHFINWLGEDLTIPPNVRAIIDESKVLYVDKQDVNCFALEYANRAALRPPPDLPGAVPISLAAHDESLMVIANRIGTMQGTAAALHTSSVNSLTAMRRDLEARYTMKVPDSCQPGFEKLMHQFAPEFAYKRYTYRQPHAAVALVRRVCNSLIAHELRRLGKPAVLAGGSPHQVASLPNVVHNHAPYLSGRDAYRHESAYDPAIVNFANAVACRSPLQHCIHAFPDTVLVLPFSGQDINVSTVVKSMILNRQRDALVAVHIPLPFVDPRINNYVDNDLEVRYERKAGKIRMYHLSSASGGYVNDEVDMMSWARSVPVTDGYNVLLEEMRHIGSIYLMHLMVTPGRQEEYVTCFKQSCGDFYILPILKPSWRFHPDEDRHFVVPTNRFNNVTAFAATVPFSKNSFEGIANKVRGQQAEVKVASQILLPRWELTADQFNSVITHASLRAEMQRRDHMITFATGLSYLDWWYGSMSKGLAEKTKHFLFNTFTLGNWRRTPHMFEDGFLERAQDAIQNMKAQNGRMEDPYSEHGTYRIRHCNRFPRNCAPDMSTFNAPDTLPPSSVLKTWRPPPVKSGAEKREEKMRQENSWPFPAYDELINESRNADSMSLGQHTMRLLTHCELARFSDSLIRAGALDAWCDNHDPSEEEELRQEVEVNALDDEEECETPGESFVGKSEGPEVPEVKAETEADTTMSTEALSETTHRSAASSCSLPATSAPVRMYTLAAHAKLTKVYHDGEITFDGQISFENGPDPSPSQLEFSERFPSLDELCLTLDVEPDLVIPCPDRGARLLAQRLLSRPAKKSELWFDPAEMAEADVADMDEADGHDSLADIVQGFWATVEKSVGERGAIYRHPSLTLDGIPASAKSTLAREIIVQRKGLVVCPTRKLAKEWSLRVNKDTTVVTQHRAPTEGRFSVLVIDEANLLSKRLLAGWLSLARFYRVKQVIVLGDAFQHAARTEEDAVFGEAPLLGPRLSMRNAFTLPQDALLCFLHANGLANSDAYRTKSRVTSSVVCLDRQPVVEDFPGKALYTRSRLHAEEVLDPHGRLMISVTQAQGTRVKEHYFTSGLPRNKHKWFQHMLAVQSVLFTRHTERLIIELPRSDFSDAFPAIPTEYIEVIDGKSQSKLLAGRPRHPGDLDMMYGPRPALGDIVDHAALSLDFSERTGDWLYSVNPDVDPVVVPADHDLRDLVSIKLAAEVLGPRVQHVSRREYKEQLDLIAEAAHGLNSVGELSWGQDPKMRCHLPGVFNLGDIQMARDRFNDLRNVLLRQLNEPKSANISVQDISDAKVMFDRYCQAFMKESWTTHAVGHFGYEYITSRAPAFLASWNDPFNFSAHSLTRTSFLKTQVKVKPGLVGGETHGQTIISNSPEMLNYFAPWARLGYKFMNDTDREDFVTDTGFSDHELSAYMMTSGMGARIEDSGNLQIDLTRQDSTHRPAHVIAYCMFLEMAGVPEHVTELYLRLRSMAYVKSLAENLYKASIKWNLGSGDPFTLNANCFMMKCCVAVEFDGVRNCAGLQKGDDFISSNEGWIKSDRGDIRSRLRYDMKIDINKPPYHAGRFIHHGVLLADPVRNFFKHFAKTHDPSVTVEDLYRSYVERRVNYTEEQAVYLKKVIPLFYSEIDAEEAHYIVEVMLSLRSFKNFRSTYKHSSLTADRVFDPPSDCAYLCAHKLLPHLSRNTLRDFRNHTDKNQLALLFAKHNVAVLRSTHPSLVPVDFTGVVISHNHVYAVLPPVPTTL